MPNDSTQISDSDEAYRLIMDAIVIQKLSPSQKISENIINDMFGISRTVSRNLIEQLIAKRFVVSVSQRVTQVAPLTLLEIKQNFTLRKMILTEILSLAAANVDFEKLILLNEKIQSLQPITGDRSALKVLKANRQLNLAMCEKTGYPLMLDWVRQLEDMAMRIYWLYVSTSKNFPYSSDQQSVILDVMKRNEPARIRQAIQDMIIQTEERVLCAFFSHPPFYKLDLKYSPKWSKHPR